MHVALGRVQPGDSRQLLCHHVEDVAGRVDLEGRGKTGRHLVTGRQVLQSNVRGHVERLSAEFITFVLDARSMRRSSDEQVAKNEKEPLLQEGASIPMINVRL